MIKITDKKIIAYSSVLIVLIIIIALFNFNYSRDTKIIILSHDKAVVSNFQKNFLLFSKTAKIKTGIEFIPVPSDTTSYVNQMDAVLSTSEAPDLFTWWSGYPAMDLVQKKLVVDLTQLWDKYKDSYSEDLRKIFLFDNRVYGFPFFVEYWAVWYNKPIFKKLQLKEPETWYEFLQICKKLKMNNITPILSSIQSHWPAFIWFEEMLIGEDPDLYLNLCEGRAKFSNPSVKKALRVWQQMIKNQYFTKPSVNMLTNAGYLWNNKRYGMVLSGSWYYSTILIDQGVKQDEIGVFILPSHNSKAGNNIIVEVAPIYNSTLGRNQKETLKLIDWWMSPDGNKEMAKMFKFFPGNEKVNTDFLPPVKQKLLKSIKRKKYRIFNRFYEATPGQIRDFIIKKMGEFMVNPNDLDRILAEINIEAEKHWGNN